MPYKSPCSHHPPIGTYYNPPKTHKTSLLSPPHHTPTMDRQDCRDSQNACIKGIKILALQITQNCKKAIRKYRTMLDKTQKNPQTNLQPPKLHIPRLPIGQKWHFGNTPKCNSHIIHDTQTKSFHKQAPLCSNPTYNHEQCVKKWTMGKKKKEKRKPWYNSKWYTESPLQ